MANKGNDNKASDNPLHQEVRDLLGLDGKNEFTAQPDTQSDNSNDSAVSLWPLIICLAVAVIVALWQKERNNRNA